MLFQKIYYELIHQLNQQDRIEIDAIINHQDSEISTSVTSILMDDERYSLSDWERKNIFVTESEDILPKLVTDAILNLRRILIDLKIKNFSADRSVQITVSDLEMVQNYTELKMRLYTKLMRVV